MSRRAFDVIPTEPKRRRNPAGRLMRCAAIIVALGSALASSAQTHKLVPSVVVETQAIRAFAPVYERYVHVVQMHGAAALQDLAIPNLVIKAPGETLRGASALREHGKVFDFCKGAVVSVKVWGVRIRGATATVMAQESAARRDITMTWDWKHTWRKTPDGWKLARIERTDIGPDTARPAVSFTVTAGETK